MKVDSRLYTFEDGVLTIKNYDENGKKIEYLFYTDLMHEVEKAFKDELKIVKFGPFLKGYTYREYEDEDRDGYPRSSYTMYSRFTPLELFQTPSSVEAFIVDKNNEDYESRDGIIYFKGSDIIISIPCGKKRIILGRNDSFANPENIMVGRNETFIIHNGKQAKEIADARSRRWYEENDHSEIELYGHEGEQVFFLSEDNKVCYGASRTDSNNRLVIPEGVEEIYLNAFRSNLTIKELVLPSSLKVIGSNAFEGAQIEKVSFPDSLLEIKCDAFSRNKLIELILPNSLTVLEEGTFSYNKQLEKISLPNKLKEIHRYALYYAGATVLEMPSSIECIQESAFGYSKIKEIHYHGSKKEWQKVRYSKHQEGRKDNIKIVFIQ